MRWLLGNVDWSWGNNRIHCSSGASLQATGLAHEMHGRRQLPQSGLVHWGGNAGRLDHSRALPGVLNAAGTHTWRNVPSVSGLPAPPTVRPGGTPETAASAFTVPKSAEPRKADGQGTLRSR